MIASISHHAIKNNSDVYITVIMRVAIDIGAKDNYLLWIIELPHLICVFCGYFPNFSFIQQQFSSPYYRHSALYNSKHFSKNCQ